MISDTLSETVGSLDYYLNEPTFAHIYAGSVRDELQKLRDDIEAMRVKLDSAISPEWIGDTSKGSA